VPYDFYGTENVHIYVINTKILEYAYNNIHVPNPHSASNCQVCPSFDLLLPNLKLLPPNLKWSDVIVLDKVLEQSNINVWLSETLISELNFAEKS